MAGMHQNGISSATLSRLDEAIAGQTGLPGSAVFRAGTRVFDPEARLREPLAVIRPADPDDVARILRWGSKEGLRISPRSGGHSFDGFPVRENTVLLDLSGLNDSRLDAQRRLHAGPGARIKQIAEHLVPAGCAVPTGDCPTVALGGLVTGGGFGYATRLLGTTLDNLIEATLVTADGELRRVDLEHDADLFWACRGGGCAAGVVTEFVIRTFPVDSVTTISMALDWSAARDVILAYDELMRAAPRELDLKLKLRTTGIGRFMDKTIPGPEDAVPGVPLVHIDGQYLGMKSEAESLIRRLLDHRALRHVSIDQEGYFDAMLHLVPLPILTDPAPETNVPQRVASDFVRGALPGSAAEAMVDFITELQEAPDLQGGGLLIEPTDGIVNEIAPDATAFPHRDARLLLEWELFKPLHPTAEYVARLDECLTRARRRMHAVLTGGRYLNYADWLDTPQAIWAGNFQRLDGIARQYDPEAMLVSRLRPDG